MAFLNVGTQKETVKEAKETIVSILELNRDREVTLKALDCLSTICGVTNTYISNCNFTNDCKSNLENATLNTEDKYDSEDEE